MRGRMRKQCVIGLKEIVMVLHVTMLADPDEDHYTVLQGQNLSVCPDKTFLLSPKFYPIGFRESTNPFELVKRVNIQISCTN